MYPGCALLLKFLGPSHEKGYLVWHLALYLGLHVHGVGGVIYCLVTVLLLSYQSLYSTKRRQIIMRWVQVC